MEAFKVSAVKANNEELDEGSPPDPEGSITGEQDLEAKNRRAAARSSTKQAKGKAAATRVIDRGARKKTDAQPQDTDSSSKAREAL